LFLIRTKAAHRQDRWVAIMKVSGICLFIVVFSGFSAPRCGATVYHSNGTASSVQFIHNNQAQNGDTITLPAGIFTWTTRVTISKAITLQGGGVGSTIVRDAVQSGQLIHWSLVAGFTSRLTGIEFQDGGRTTANNAPAGILRVDGSNTNGSMFRMDHCKWNNLNGAPVFDTVIGVIDHNQFVLQKFPTAIYIYGTRWNGQTAGDGAWAAPTGLGSSQFLFIEDNDIHNNRPASGCYVTDAYAGARFVVRHNTIFNCGVNNHGTESTGRARGGRAMEIYQNTFTGTDISKFVGGARSGVVLFHDNRISGYWGNLAQLPLANFRNFLQFLPWGGADGTNPWDVNEPNVFFTGTAAANSSRLTVTVSGANWTPNQWAGYTVRRTSNVCNSNSVTFAWITRNTANTITYTDNGDYGTPSLSFCAGDTLEIRKVDHALDQPGRAGGSLITGGNQSPVRPPGWNDQVTEPCYAWNNGPANFVGSAGVRANVHYFNNTPMPGYTPYVYPHPLTLLPTGTARAFVADFNGAGRPDYVLQTPNTRKTAIWYLNNNVVVGGAYGPTLPPAWNLVGVADLNLDGHPDYALFNSSNGQTAIWYLSGPTFIGGVYGPALPSGWELVATADFNGDSKPDYLLYNGSTRQTAIWYLNNNVVVGGAYGPTLPPRWNLVGVADFNRDGHPDYLLFNSITRQTAIWYLSGPTFLGGAYGPTLPRVWLFVAAADFNGDSQPDYLLYNVNTQQTAIWYLNNNVFVGGAYGPTLPAGWSFFGP
jgi:hypothetical protein